MSPPPVRGSVVVITGASSGIGRAAAATFAREGANLVLAARDAGALADAVAQCEAEGARAIAVPTDVADGEAVERLAGELACAFFGAAAGGMAGLIGQTKRLEP